MTHAGNATPDEIPDAAVARLRALPAVGRLLESGAFRDLAATLGRAAVVEALRAEIAELRAAARAGATSPAVVRDPVGSLAAAVERRIARASGPDLRRVFNATGVVVHTNLGRAPLSDAAAAAMFRVARGYSDLEMDRARGRRGSRQTHLDALLARLFPGRSSLVVNNAAAAVLLALDSLASGKAVVVSRGELVEIGASFRIPEILEKSGARLLEVGATNRTRASDYRRALETAPVGALLRVHQSNFRIEGFTEAASTEELAALAAEFGAPLIEDFGSGNLLPLGRYRVSGRPEPTVFERLGAGADLVVFSGDKLLGGPQAGILIGAPELVAACRENPLARAVRADKTCIAGLQATLWSYVAGKADEEIPVLRALARSASEIEAAAISLRRALEPAPGWTLEVVPVASRVGGGAAPDARLASAALALAHPAQGADAIRAALLAGDPAVAARVRRDRVLLDLRAVPPEDLDELAEAVGRVVRDVA